MKIGFDLDEVFVGHPPLVPGWLIQKLYREQYNGILYYRIPGKFEQKIRQLSHLSFFRLPIRKNIRYLSTLSQKKEHSLFLISSRFGFLKRQTDILLSKTKLKHFFKHMYFNYKNEQPHLFKSKIIGKENIQRYVDDDLSLLLFLSLKNPKTTFFWLNSKKNGKIRNNLYAITSINQLIK